MRETWDVRRETWEERSLTVVCCGGVQAVQAALEAAARGRSTVVIAHRLATVRHAHTIAVVDRGVVAESGTHDELVRKRGLYWDLLQQQGPSEAIAWTATSSDAILYPRYSAMLWFPTTLCEREIVVIILRHGRVSRDLNTQCTV